jgi:hypothetical protein
MLLQSRAVIAFRLHYSRIGMVIEGAAPLPEGNQSRRCGLAFAHAPH